MKAAIISIGDEILIGQVINTNAAFISEQLNSVGIEVGKIITVGDSVDDIYFALKETYPAHDAVIITGGLGPTHDDVTREAVCRFFSVRLVQSPEARENVKLFLKMRNREWSASAEDQTYIPDGAQPIRNKYGTAAGEFFANEGKYLIVMPGVPYEMESMMTDFVVPCFRKQAGSNIMIHRTILTTGIPESEIASRLGDLGHLLGSAKLAFLPSPTGVRLRITVSGQSGDPGREVIDRIEDDIRSKVGEYIYGTGTQTLEELLGEVLTEKGLTISVAESCTGGMIAHKLTNVAGSSKYFERGVVAYSNRSKVDFLKVPADTIEIFGAVSAEVAKIMAEGIRSVSGTDIGLSTTGIAGPSGGTAEKPVGLVWVGYSGPGVTIAQKFYFGDGRSRVKERASQAAMDLVRRQLLKTV